MLSDQDLKVLAGLDHKALQLHCLGNVVIGPSPEWVSFPVLLIFLCCKYVIFLFMARRLQLGVIFV